MTKKGVFTGVFVDGNDLICGDMKPLTKSIFGQIVIGLVLLFLAFLYWNAYNVKSTIKDVREEMLDVVTLSGTEPSTKHQSEIDHAVASISGNKFTRPSADTLKKPFMAFVADWKAAKAKLSGPVVEGHHQNVTNSFKPVLETYTDLAESQGTAAIAIPMIVLFFLFLAINSEILRDIVSNCIRLDVEKQLRADAGDTFTVRPPYSLARTQLGVWITIISSTYLYAVLWDRYPIGDINSTALLLMGISAGTFATGAILDTVEAASGIPRSQNEVSSGSFWEDILADKDGLSIHRFQNVVWTMVAIIIYIYKYSHPQKLPGGLPDLDSTLLALTGISSATYLTLKARENVPSAGNVELKITLVPDDSLPQAVKQEITASKDGYSQAIVLLDDGAGNTLKAWPASTSSKFDFSTGSIPTGKYKTITVTWQGTLTSSTPPGPVTQKGSYTGAIDGKTQPIIIKMK